MTGRTPATNAKPIGTSWSKALSVATSRRDRPGRRSPDHHHATASQPSPRRSTVFPLTDLTIQNRLHIQARPSTSGPVKPLSRGSVERLAVIKNRALTTSLFRGEVDPAEELALAKRMDAIDASLAHRDQEAVRSALVDMFLVLKATDGSEMDWAMRVTAYMSALSDLPAWAVVEACASISRKGTGTQKAFIPSAPEIRDAAEIAFAHHAREREDIAAVLRALQGELPAPPPERPKIERGYHPSWDLLAQKTGIGRGWEQASEALRLYTVRNKLPEAE